MVQIFGDDKDKSKFDSRGDLILVMLATIPLGCCRKT
jgi:hypothetical protein